MYRIERMRKLLVWRPIESASGWAASYKLPRRRNIDKLDAIPWRIVVKQSTNRRRIGNSNNSGGRSWAAGYRPAWRFRRHWV